MTIKLYGNGDSGNCYKVKLILSHLGLDFETTELSVLGDRDRDRADLDWQNPNGKVPFVVLEDGTGLAESNAILNYFAQGTDYLPDDRLGRAQVLQWMFFEQNNHEPNIASRRYFAHLAEPASDEAMANMLAGGHRALGVMEGHLAENDWFAAGRYTIADIALYAYTHVADEGGFDLEPYPNVRAWLERVREQPGHVSMK